MTNFQAESWESWNPDVRVEVWPLPDPIGSEIAPDTSEEIGTWRPQVVQLPGGEILVMGEGGEFLDEATAQVMEAAKAARWKADRAKEQAFAMAEALAGQPVTLGRDDAGGLVLLDGRGNELDAGAGEGEELRAAAVLLWEASDSYQAVQVGDLTEESRIFGIGGPAWSSSMRFSPGYKKRLRLRARKQAREAMDLVRDRLGGVIYSTRKEDGGYVMPVFYTFTSPQLVSSDVGRPVTDLSEERRLYRAWTLLRKTDLWKEGVFAAFKGTEKKPKLVFRDAGSEAEVAVHGHFHVLSWAKYIDQGELAATWWSCLRTATQEAYGFDLNDMARDKDDQANRVKACCDVRMVRKKVKGGRDKSAISLEDAIQETLKYELKPEDAAERDPITGEILSLPGSWLRENAWRRSARLFERLGAARSKWELPDWCEARSGRTKEELERKRQQAARDRACSLDTQAISDAMSPDQREGDEEPEKKKRPPTLRDLMKTLPLGKWLEALERKASRASSFFREALEERGYVFLDDWEPPDPGGNLLALMTP